MSPRSEEFLARARERLALAGTALDAGFPEGAASAAYYAMLYAARAALSESDRSAKTHTGVWSLFAEEFVQSGRVPPKLLSRARDAQRRREAADYDAASMPAEDAAAIIRDAEAFVAAVEALGE